MSKTKVEVCIDSRVKKKADKLFEQLGLDMSTAVELFLHQCVLYGRLPLPYNKRTQKAMEEARKIAEDGSYSSYTDIDELFKALNS